MLSIASRPDPDVQVHIRYGYGPCEDTLPLKCRENDFSKKELHRAIQLLRLILADVRLLYSNLQPRLRVSH